MICGFGHAPEIYTTNPEILKVSPSAIMEFLKSPAHYHAKYIRGIHKQTKAMEQGNQVHMAILEPERFAQTYCAKPSQEDYPNALVTMDDWKPHCERLGLKKSGKKEDVVKACIDADPTLEALHWDFIVANATTGKTPVTETDWAHIQELKQSLDYNSRLKTLFGRPGWREQMAWIFDEADNILYKFKTDFVDQTGVIVDIKKTPSAEMNKLSKKIYHENLYVQAAMYFDLWTLLYQHLRVEGTAPIPKPRAFVFAAFEMESPYIWEDYNLDLGSMDAGEKRYKKAIFDLICCRATNVWPTYKKKMEPIAIPHYAWAELDFLAERELDNVTT